MNKRILRSVLFLSLLASSAAPSLADTVNYEYDALGRLQRVEHSDGTVITYTLDPAGNRTQVATTIPPGAPPSISVPSSSTSGSYTVSWGKATGTVTAYKLYEATKSSFSGQVEVYSGTGRSKGFSGKGNGTYYYRVMACNGGACSAYTAGGNPTVVSLPGVPPWITVPSSSNTGSYTISWGKASGSVTRYELYEATNASFSGQVRVYNGGSRSAGISDKDTGTYYYRVRACNASVCSAYRTGTNAISVSAPIQVLNPDIDVGCCTTTSIATLADLNGNAGTIHSFSESCSKASVVIESGAQSVKWSNSNTFYLGCEIGVNQQCSASYVIRKSSTGQLYSGTASIVVVAQGRPLPPNMSCP